MVLITSCLERMNWKSRELEKNMSDTHYEKRTKRILKRWTLKAEERRVICWPSQMEWRHNALEIFFNSSKIQRKVYFLLELAGNIIQFAHSAFGIINTQGPNRLKATWAFAISQERTLHPAQYKLQTWPKTGPRPMRLRSAAMFPLSKRDTWIKCGPQIRAFVDLVTRHLSPRATQTATYSKRNVSLRRSVPVLASWPN